MKRQHDALDALWPLFSFKPYSTVGNIGLEAVFFFSPEESYKWVENIPSWNLKLEIQLFHFPSLGPIMCLLLMHSFRLPHDRGYVLIGLVHCVMVSSSRPKTGFVEEIEGKR